MGVTCQSFLGERESKTESDKVRVVRGSANVGNDTITSCFLNKMDKRLNISLEYSRSECTRI